MLVELDEVAAWINKHAGEFMYESWHMPLDYDESNEIAKALVKHFTRKKENHKKRVIPGVGGPLDPPTKLW